MADPEPGAPIAKDAIDPELVKLARARPKIGVITAAGIVFLCVMFLLRLNADRRFGGGDAKPTKTTVADIVAGNVAIDELVLIDAEPVVSHAVRAAQAKGGTGLRLVPIRGTAEKLWVVLPGNGWERPTGFVYQGRLRKLDDLPFADAISDFAADHPRPMFATAAAVRAGFAGGAITSVGNDAITPADRDEVAFDLPDPDGATIIASFTDKLPDVKAWTTALAAAGLTLTTAPTTSADRARFEVSLGVAETTAKLATAKLAATRVEEVTRHYKTTWGALRASPPGGFVVDGKTIPDAQIELVGLYTARGTPPGAYVVITGERPEDYWYVLPITIALAGIGLIFGWALVRAVRRDLLPTRAT